MERKKVLALSGSTRAQSSNGNLIRAIAQMAEARFDVTLFDSLAALPHFNPDLDTEYPPEEVARFRHALRAFDGILICTPEYAMGVPGTLKNAIDWTVSSMEFSGKPVALVTASSQGQKGHAALLETLQVIEAKTTEATRLLISFIKTKVNGDGNITDPKTAAAVITLIDAFASLMEGE